MYFIYCLSQHYSKLCNRHACNTRESGKFDLALNLYGFVNISDSMKFYIWQTFSSNINNL